MFWGMRVAPACGRRQLCWLRRPLLPLWEGGWRASRWLRVGGGLLEGSSRNPAACWANQVGGGAWGRRGAAMSAFWVRPSGAPAMRKGVRVSVRGGAQFAWLRSGVGGLGSGVAGLCVGGVCGSPGRAGVPCGRGLLTAGVCGLLGFWGALRLAWRGSLWWACLGVLAGGGQSYNSFDLLDRLESAPVTTLQQLAAWKKFS